MASLKELDLGKVKYVDVFVKSLHAPLTYTCYDQGEGAWKEEAGMLWAHVVQLVKHPATDFEPRWTPIVSFEHVDRVEVTLFMEALRARWDHRASSA